MRVLCVSPLCVCLFEYICVIYLLVVILVINHAGMSQYYGFKSISELFHYFAPVLCENMFESVYMYMCACVCVLLCVIPCGNVMFSIHSSVHLNSFRQVTTGAREFECSSSFTLPERVFHVFETKIRPSFSLCFFNASELDPLMLATLIIIGQALVALVCIFMISNCFIFMFTTKPRNCDVLIMSRVLPLPFEP